LCKESKVSTDVLKAHAHSTREHLENEAMRYLDKEHRDCHQVLKTSTYEQFKNINPDRVEQTCQWALSHPLYQRWKDSATDDLLWISADPGCGKSVLSKSLVDEELLSDANSSTLCYFFFKDNDEQNSLGTGLCALLHQLFQHQPHLLQHAVPAWKKNGSKLQQEIDELWRILLAATSDVAGRNTICVLDALDECRDRDRSDIIAKLARFHEDAASHSPHRSWLKFIVTSRPYDDIQRRFEQIPPSLPAIRLRGEMENDQIHAEINSVIHVQVLHLAKDLGLHESTSSRLEQTLLAMEHRTYLWLHLAIDDIRMSLRDSFRPDEETIESVPSSVEGAYEKILARITKAQRQKVKLILQIIVGARRPLAVGEMALALGLATSTRYRTSADAQIDPVHLEKQLRHWCGLFVFVNQSRIYLIHQTAREFLIARQDHKYPKSLTYDTWRHCVQQAEMEQMMTSICIRCLRLEDREVPSIDKVSTEVSVVGESQRELVEYSCEWWTTHYSLSQGVGEENTFQDALALYNTEGEAFKLWFNVFWAKTRQYDRANDMTPIRLAAMSNHDKVLDHFLDKIGMNLHAKDEAGRTALYWASELGHDKILQMLVDRGADINAQGGYYGSALQAASAQGHDKIVQMLLDRGADVNAQDGEYDNALQVASYGGHEKVVQMLLDRGADVNAQDEHYGSALQAASAEGHERVVQMLVDRGADVNAQDGEYDNALQAASYRGHEKVVQMLLDRGADVNAQDGEYGNALQEASAEGYEKIVQMLLDRGADVNAQGGEYCGALQAASYGGHDKIVQMLLDRGADVNAQDEHYGSVLQAASAQGHERVVQMLVDRGADINAQGGYYGSVLRAASAGDHEKVVQMLLDRGADVNAQDEHYGSALQAASAQGHERVVQMLLDRGADVNAQGGEYGKALQAASSQGREKVVQMLLDRGADVNAGGGECGNALQAASDNGHEKIVQLLLDRGAHADVRGGRYGNALQAASYNGHDEIVQLLLDRRADVNAHGGKYGSALQAASAKGHDEIVQMLLGRGADVNAVDGKYGGALQAASYKRYDKTVQILLDRRADANAKGGPFGNALQEASAEGHEKVVQTLLDAGADVNAQGGHHGSALQAASAGGYDKTVRTLLDAGADVNAQSGYYGSALQAASAETHVKVVQMLLDAGADVNIDAMFLALRENLTTIVPLFLPYLAEDVVSEKDEDHGMVLLHWAAELGYQDLTTRCLYLGAEVDATDKYGETALHYAAENGHLEIVQKLIQVDADVTILDCQGRTALDCALGAGPDEGERYYPDIVAYLQR
jgi:ankyrin repeat protein